jgi:tRNA nucleotidyltransferase (CCA-adding enzyme)
VAALNRYRLNVLPVVRRGRVVGALTRQVADVALGHGLGDRAVADVATAEVPQVAPGAGLDEVRRMILSGGHRFVLVGEPGTRPQGIITRAELLHGLYGAAQAAEADDGAEGENLSEVLAARLPAETWALLRRAGTLAVERGMHAYLVGGAVRDALLSLEVRDVDVVVEGDGPALARALAAEIAGRARAHEAFGTAALETPGGARLDLATARTEHYPRPGALPRVEPGGLRQDLFRRDFTINAMAVRLHPDHTGDLLDPFGGRQDLAHGRIRVLHGLSFLEDPTRAFRAIRFAARLHFSIAGETEHLLRVARREGAFARLSAARLSRELERLFSERRLVRAVRLLAGLRLLEVLHPAVRMTPRISARLERCEEALAWLRLEPGAPAVRGWLVPLAILLEPLPARARREALARALLRPADRALLQGAPERAALLIRRLTARRGADDRALHEACRDEPAEVLLLAMAFAAREEVRRRLARFLTVLRTLRAEVTGRDLLRLGIPQGPRIAAGLRAALAAKLDGAQDREAQLRAALRAARAP